MNIRPTSPRLRSSVLAASLLTALAAPPAGAQSEFTGAVSNDWFNAANWQGRVRPNAFSDAVVHSGKSARINANTTIASLDIWNGGSVTVDNAVFSLDQLYLGLFGAPTTFTAQNHAQVTIHGGAVIGANATGTMNVSGANTLVTVSGGELALGSNGAGFMTISDGARVVADSSRLGVGGSDTGTVLVTGANSAWDISGAVSIGYGGQGVLSIENGATGSSGEMNFNYYSAGASGTMTVTGAGSTWTATNYVWVSKGSLTVADGGTFIVTSGGIVVGSSAHLHLGTGGLGGDIVGSPILLYGTMTADHTDNRTLSTPIYYNGSVIKKGSGTLTLDADNSQFGGTITVIDGTLRATGNADALGAFDASLLLNGGHLALANNTGLNFGRAVTVSADTTITSDRRTSGNGVTHTLGALSIAGKTLAVAKGANVTGGTAGLTFTRTTLTAAGTVFDTAADTVLTPGAIGGNYAFEKTGAGQLTLASASSRNTTAGATTLTAGTLRATHANALNTNAAAALNLNGGTFQSAINSDTTFRGTAVTVGGNATIAPSRTSNGNSVTHTLGTLHIGSSTLTVGHGTNFNANQTGSLVFGATTLGGNATFNLANTNGTATGVTTLGALDDQGTARTLTKKGAGTLTLASAATSLVNGTAVNLEAGRLNLNHASALGDRARLTLSSGATLALGANASLAALDGSGGSVVLGARTLTVGHTSDNLSSSFGGILSGASGSLVKRGSGTLTLSGANTYTGGTTIDGGTLIAGHLSAFGTGTVRVNSGVLDFGGFAVTNTLDVRGGSLSGLGNYSGTQTVTGTVSYSGTVGGAVVVSDGATLSGTGTFNGAVTLGSGSTLSPGNSPGTLVFAGGLTLNAGVTLKFELGSVSDLIRVSGGTLTGPSSGSVVLNITDAGGFIDGTYTLFDFAGATLSDFDLSDFVFGSTIEGYDYVLAFSGDTLVLNASSTAVPEPSAFAALAGFAVSVFAVTRRRLRP